MSDYVKAKVIRLPFPKELYEISKSKNYWDSDDYLEEKLGDMWDTYPHTYPYFEHSPTETPFIDLVLEDSYGEESGDYGFVSYLTENEIKKYRPLFEKITSNFEDKDLRKVVYCYYNCSESEDYYDISED